MIKIAFIGTGFMASSLVSGILKEKISDGKHIYAINDAFPESAADMCERYGICRGKREDICSCDVILWAVKPQNFEEAYTMYSGFFTSSQLHLTIMAGIPISSFEEKIPGLRVIRIMPNIALSVGKSASAYSCSEACSEEDEMICRTIFSSLGRTAGVDESLLGAVTALSGSGPAYFCRLVEIMAEYGKEMGIPDETSELFSVQTLLGTARLLEELEISPAELRKRVTSKKGTTEAAVTKMDELGLAKIVKEGMRSAKQRSDELGKK